MFLQPPNPKRNSLSLRKKIFRFPFFIVVLLTLGCNTEKENDDCIDESAIKPEAPCIALYDPVCGCNKKTYSNSCEATHSGVLKWTKGSCPTD